MKFSDSDIEARVIMLAAFLLKDTKIKAEDQPIVTVAVELISNLLCNINDIAQKP
jgi:hypothetical protein